MYAVRKGLGNSFIVLSMVNNTRYVIKYNKKGFKVSKSLKVSMFNTNNNYTKIGSAKEISQYINNSVERAMR